MRASCRRGAALAALVLGALCPLAGLAQPVAPGVYDGRPIVSLELAGPAAPTREAFIELTGVRPGEPYSASTIRRMLEQLYRLDEYLDIQVDAEPQEEGVALIVAFIAKTRLNAFELQGHHQSNTRLREVSGLSVGQEVTDAAITGALERLRTWYARRGYVVDIRPSIHQEDGGTRARIVIGITERERARIRTIAFPGSPAFSRLRHLIALRSARGEYFSHDHLDRGVSRLQDLYHTAGYLKAAIGPPKVTIERRGIRIEVPIERGPHYRFVVDGEPGVSKPTLLEQLTLLQEQRDDEPFLGDEADRLTQFLSDRGFRRAAVQIRREAETEAEILIRVIVESGPRFALKDVAFEGTHLVPTHELEPLLATVASGWIRTRFANRERLDADRERIESWYLTQGFLSAKVAVEAAEDPSRKAVRVVFRIVEGPQTRIGDLHVEGNLAVPTQTLLDQVDVQPGAPYVESGLRAARAALLSYYNDHGYVYSAVEPVVEFSDDRSRVDVRFRIDEGVQVRIGAITLEGNRRTRDSVILRELQVRTGDVYSQRRILESQRRVARLGFLSEIRLEPANPEQPEAVKDLTLTVAERNAGTVDLGAGYSNFEGLRGFTELTYRNLAGAARRVAFRLEGSRLERRAVLSYRQPWFLGQRVEFRSALLREIRIEENRDYKRDSYGGNVALDRELSPTLRASLIYEYQRHRLTPPDPADPSSEDQDRVNIGSLTPVLIRDTRDDPFNPRSGSVSSVAFENAARILASDEQFWKATVSGSRYHAVGRSLVAAVSLRVGYIRLFGEDEVVPPTERFYLGGRSSVRGYEEDRLGVIDTETPTGGTVMMLGNVELRIGLARALGAVVFLDTGNFWPLPEGIEWRNLDFKSTVGGGIRYNTPVGPLRLDYGHKLQWQPGERHGTFHFTLGHAF